MDDTLHRRSGCNPAGQLVFDSQHDYQSIAIGGTAPNNALVPAFLIAWSDNTNMTYEIRAAQVIGNIAACGNLEVPPYNVSPVTTHACVRPAVASLANYNWVITYNCNVGTPFNQNYDVRAEISNKNDNTINPTESIIVAGNYQQIYPAAGAGISDNQAMIAWADNASTVGHVTYEIKAQRKSWPRSLLFACLDMCAQPDWCVD